MLLGNRQQPDLLRIQLSQEPSSQPERLRALRLFAPNDSPPTLGCSALTLAGAQPA